MGKKSKRRGGGGGGGKRNAGVSNSHNRIGGEAGPGLGGTIDTFSAEEAASLLRVPRPSSFKGIISTNDAPTLCLHCFTSVLGRGVIIPCCGKAMCPDCNNSPHRHCLILDLRGQYRCKFCNALVSKRDALLKKEAQLGKPWAQFTLGRLLANAPTGSFNWLRKAASAGHPYAFEEFAILFLGGKGINCDLRLARSFAEKARSFDPGLRLRCNKRLLDVADAYIESGEKIEANGILLSIMGELDPDGLDAVLCCGVASRLPNSFFSAEMYARSFCYARIESAIRASYDFHRLGEFTLSKLWLDVACKTKTLFEISQARNGAAAVRAHYEKTRDYIRSDLREMRNSCGGCGGALSGERRKYCRCCRTYCYCNEDCQKKHWNNGHREECKQVEVHMRRILREIRYGRFDSLCQLASKCGA